MCIYPLHWHLFFLQPQCIQNSINSDAFIQIFKKWNKSMMQTQVHVVNNLFQCTLFSFNINHFTWLFCIQCISVCIVILNCHSPELYITLNVYISSECEFFSFQCSVTCHLGEQTRLVHCLDKVTQELSSDCNDTEKPDSIKLCLSKPCPKLGLYVWRSLYNV